MDRLQQAHAALQQQKEELSCLLREREKLVAQSVESESLASEYRKQLVAQEASLVQMKQSGMFDRIGRQQQDELMVRSGNRRPTAEPEGTNDAVQYSSLSGSEVGIPHQQPISQGQPQTYTYTQTQEMEFEGQVSGKSNSLSKMHSWYVHPDTIQTQLPGKETCHGLQAAASSKTRHLSEKSSALETDTQPSVCYSLHPQSVSEDSVVPVDMPEPLHTEHNAVQPSPQTRHSLVSRGCQTRTPSVKSSHQQTVHHRETQTTSSSFSQECVDHTSTIIAGVDVGIQTDCPLDLYQSRVVEQTGHLIVSTLSASEQIERSEERSEHLTWTTRAYPQNRSISLSLLELIEELELSESNGGEMESSLELEVSNLDSEDENAMLSDIFFLRS